MPPQPIRATSRQKFIPKPPDYKIFSPRGLQLGRVKQEKSGDQKEKSNFQAWFVERSQRSPGVFLQVFFTLALCCDISCRAINSSFSCPPTKASTKLAPGCLVCCLKKNKKKSSGFIYVDIGLSSPFQNNHIPAENTHGNQDMPKNGAL